MTTRERRGPLTVSMLFCLGEWAMHLGPTVLLQMFQGKPLLMTLFTVSIIDIVLIFYTYMAFYLVGFYSI